MTQPIRKTITLLECDTALTIAGTSRETDPDYFVSNATGATITLTTTETGNGMAHQVCIRNDGGNNLSGIDFTIVGFYGIYPITEIITGPTANATVKSDKYFSRIPADGVTVDSTLGANTVDIGIVEISATTLIKSCWRGLNEGICVTIILDDTQDAAINYTAQFTRSKVEPDSPNHRTNVYTGLYDSWNWFNHDDTDLVNATGNVSSNTQEPPSAYRGIVNSYTQDSTPTIDLEIQQSSIS